MNELPELPDPLDAFPFRVLRQRHLAWVVTHYVVVYGVMAWSAWLAWGYYRRRDVFMVFAELMVIVMCGAGILLMEWLKRRLKMLNTEPPDPAEMKPAA